LMLVEDKAVLMRQFGKRQLMVQLQLPLAVMPSVVKGRAVELTAYGGTPDYTYDAQREQTVVGAVLLALELEGIEFKDVNSSQSSLEDIFVGLVRDSNRERGGA